MINNFVKIVLVMTFIVSGLISDEIGKPFVQINDTAKVFSVAVSSDGKYSLSAGLGIVLRDMHSGRSIRIFNDIEVNQAVFSKDNKYIISSNRDGTIKFFDIKTAKLLNSIDVGHTSTLAISPNGKYLISGGKTSVLLINIKTKKIIREYKGHKSYVNCVSFSHNGKFFLSASSDKTIRQYSIDNSINKVLIKSDVSFRKNSFLITSDDKELLFAQGQNIRVVNFKLHKIVDKFFDHSVAAMCMSSDGKYLIIGSGIYIYLYDYKTHKLKKRITAHRDSIEAMAIHPDGKSFLTGSEDYSTKYWETKTLKNINNFNNTSFIVETKFANNNDYIYTTNINNMFDIWNIQKGKSLLLDYNTDKLYFNRWCIAFSSNGTYTAFPSKDDRSIVIKNNLDPTKDFSIQVENSIKFLIFDLNEKYIIVKESGLGLVFYNLETKKKRVLNLDVNDILGGSNTNVVAVSKNYIATCDDKKANLHIWNLKSKKRVNTINTEKHAIDLKFSPDEKTILASYKNGFVKLYNIKDGHRLKSFKNLVSNDYATSISFTHDGKQILTGSYNGYVDVFNIQNMKNISHYKAHDVYISSIDSNKNDKYILTGSYDKSVKLWNKKTTKELIKMISFTDGEWISITPQGYFNASKNGAKHLNVLTTPMTVTSIDTFYDKFYRPDIVKKVLSGKKITQQDTLKDIIKNQPAPHVEILRVSETMDKDELLSKTSQQYIYLTLRITSKGANVGDVKILNNGIAIKTDNLRGLKLKKKNKFKYKKYKVYLKRGLNHISVNATNKDNSMRSNIASYTIEANLKKAKSKNLHAVVIGIDKFTDSDNNLAYTVKDAKAFAKLLKKTASKVYDNVDIKLLTTKDETTKANIKKVLKKYAKKVNTNDTFIFYGATHGFVDELDGKYYFITSNYDGDLKNSIDKNTLVSLLANVKMQNKLIILDTCYSTEGSEDMLTDLVNPSLQKISKNGISIFAGSGTQQEALDGYKGHGLFTYTLLEGLRDIKKIGNKDRTITVSELGSYVENQVPLYADKVNFIQTPLFEKSGKNFDIGK